MIIAAIPARAGSKSIPNKNISDINGRPAIAYSIETAMAVPEINRVVVSSDSYEYAGIARHYGAFTLVRPAEFSRDESTDLEWLRHFYNKLPPGGLDDIIVILRPTTPLRRVEVVSEAIKRFQIWKYSVDSMRSAHEMSESAYKCFEMTEYDRFEPITNYIDVDTPRQLLAKTYQPNGYVDIIHASNLYNDTVYGKNILAYITPRVTEIDSKEDLDYIRWEVLNKMEDKSKLSDVQVSKESLRILSDELKAVNKLEGR